MKVKDGAEQLPLKHCHADICFFICESAKTDVFLSAYWVDVWPIFALNSTNPPPARSEHFTGLKPDFRWTQVCFHRDLSPWETFGPSMSHMKNPQNCCLGRRESRGVSNLECLISAALQIRLFAPQFCCWHGVKFSCHKGSLGGLNVNVNQSSASTKVCIIVSSSELCYRSYSCQVHFYLLSFWPRWWHHHSKQYSSIVWQLLYHQRFKFASY